MGNTKYTGKIRAAAEYIEETRAPAKEKEIIERILTTASVLRRLADEMERETTESEGDAHAADDQ